MDEVIVVENSMSVDGMRRAHLMSNAPFGDVLLRSYGLPAESTIGMEAGVWHVRAEWRAREAFCGTEWWTVREKALVLWALDKGQRVSVAARDAALEFERVFGQWPRFAAIRTMPRGVENELDVDIPAAEGVEPLALVECTFVPDGFVMVF